MHAVNIRELKNNPSSALRQARDDMVVVVNRDEPQALLVDLQQVAPPGELAGVRVALAVTLFKQGNVSLGYAARLAGRSLVDMMTLLGQMGIPLVQVSGQDAEDDLAEMRRLRRQGIPP